MFNRDFDIKHRSLGGISVLKVKRFVNCQLIEYIHVHKKVFVLLLHFTEFALVNPLKILYLVI